MVQICPKLFESSYTENQITKHTIFSVVKGNKNRTDKYNGPWTASGRWALHESLPVLF